MRSEVQVLLDPPSFKPIRSQSGIAVLPSNRTQHFDIVQREYIRTAGSTASGRNPGALSRAAEQAVLFQVKYTNPVRSRDRTNSPSTGSGGKICTTSDQNRDRADEPACDEVAADVLKRLSSSGSDQAREGRLVDALAVRGDERRDTLR